MTHLGFRFQMQKKSTKGTPFDRGPGQMRGHLPASEAHNIHQEDIQQVRQASELRTLENLCLPVLRKGTNICIGVSFSWGQIKLIQFNMHQKHLHSPRHMLLVCLFHGAKSNCFNLTCTKNIYTAPDICYWCVFFIGPNQIVSI